VCGGKEKRREESVLPAIMHGSRKLRTTPGTRKGHNKDNAEEVMDTPRSAPPLSLPSRSEKRQTTTSMHSTHIRRGHRSQRILSSPFRSL
jgi:hypothetical protein